MEINHKFKLYLPEAGEEIETDAMCKTWLHIGPAHAGEKFGGPNAAFEMPNLKRGDEIMLKVPGGRVAGKIIDFPVKPATPYYLIEGDWIGKYQSLEAGLSGLGRFELVDDFACDPPLVKTSASEEAVALGDYQRVRELCWDCSPGEKHRRMAEMFSLLHEQRRRQFFRWTVVERAGDEGTPEPHLEIFLPSKDDDAPSARLELYGLTAKAENIGTAALYPVTEGGQELDESDANLIMQWTEVNRAEIICAIIESKKYATPDQREAWYNPVGGGVFSVKES